MKAKAIIERKHAFVVQPRPLKRLWELLSQEIGSTEATANCADALERNFQSFEDLESYENSRGSKIITLRLWAHSEDWKQSCLIHFREYHRPVGAQLEGEQPMVSRLRDEIDSLLDGLRPWWSPLARLDFFYIAIAGLLFFSIIAQLMVGEQPNSRAPLSFGKAIVGAGIVFGFLAAVALVGWVLNRIRARFFPVATFAIGQGWDRHELDEKVRWVVIVGFLVSVFSSIVVALLV